MAIEIDRRSRAYGAYGIYDGQELNRRTHDALETAAAMVDWGDVQVMQGGLSGGAVGASAATHDGLDVADISTRDHSQAECFRYVSALMECGMILFLRGYVDRMVKHGHGVMVGARYAHPDARAQIYARGYGYVNGGAGLAGAKGARWWGPPRKRLTTWADSPRNPANIDPTPGTVQLEALQWGMRNRANPEERGAGDNDGEQLQRILKARGLYTGPIDGILGPQTRAAFERWQAFTFNVGKSHKWADGIPGQSSLERLGFKVLVGPKDPPRP